MKSLMEELESIASAGSEIVEMRGYDNWKSDQGSEPSDQDLAEFFGRYDLDIAQHAGVVEACLNSAKEAISALEIAMDGMNKEAERELGVYVIPNDRMKAMEKISSAIESVADYVSANLESEISAVADEFGADSSSVLRPMRQVQKAASRQIDKMLA